MRENTDQKNFEYGRFLCNETNWITPVSFQLSSTVFQFHFTHNFLKKDFVTETFSTPFPPLMTKIC